MASHVKQAHVAGLTATEYALLCYLRLHPDVAATYGITTCKQDCSGCQRRKTCAGVSQKTTIGWMLMQTLEAQGMKVEWYDQLPFGVSADGKGNEAGAVWIKSVTRRPGARMKPLTERPEVAPPDHSAVQRAHGRLPRVAFPLLVKLATQRQRGRWPEDYELRQPHRAARRDSPRGASPAGRLGREAMLLSPLRQAAAPVADDLATGRRVREGALCV